MKIAIIGYGRMGKTIERLALAHGDVITCRIDQDNQEEFDSEAFRTSDAAIEFTTPSTARQNVLRCIEAGVPVVCGSTGWTAALPEVQNICREKGGSLLWASNFSIGVNIFMAINRRLASIMNFFPEYSPRMVETHHIHKLDHPSGTAVTLAQEIVADTDRIKCWAEPDGNHKLPADTLPIEHIRQGEVPGIHTITWDSAADDITITHSAKNRDGFAKGAVLAAHWLAGNPGVHTIREMLSDITPDFN